MHDSRNQKNFCWKPAPYGQGREERAWAALQGSRFTRNRRVAPAGNGFMPPVGMERWLASC